MIQSNQHHKNQQDVYKWINPKHYGLIISLLFLISSVVMTLFNKYILKTWEFKYPCTMVLYQNFIVSICMLLGRKLNLLEFTFRKEVVQKWLKCAFLFACMLSTSAIALQYLPVSMIAIFKNLGTCLACLGDRIFFNVQHSKNIVYVIILILIGGFASCITDLQFTFLGYFWMTVHTVIQSTYILLVRKVKTQIQINDYEMVFYNVTMALPFFFMLGYINSEWDDIDEYPFWNDSSFLALFLSSGLIFFHFFFHFYICFTISLSCFMCMIYAGPTHFAIIGNFNKIPLTILGFILFNYPVDGKNISSISFTIMAGFLYSYIQHQEKNEGKNQLEDYKFDIQKQDGLQSIEINDIGTVDEDEVETKQPKSLSQKNADHQNHVIHQDENDDEDDDEEDDKDDE